MASRRNDLEIIYNLQWNHNTGKTKMDKTNLIGMYDIPATTMTWELHKSYLLKNSGTTGDDVKVSYYNDCGIETKIENQDDFQVAMYHFRAKARNGDIINLKLDRISDQSSTNLAGNDVETQFESMQSHCCRESDTPPQWFVEYMDEFQKAMILKLDDVIADSAAALATTVAELNQKHCHNHCKCHVLFENSQEVKDSYKRKMRDVSTTDGCEKKDESSKLKSKLEKLDRKYLKKRASREKKIERIEKYTLKEHQPEGDTLSKLPEPPCVCEPVAPKKEQSPLIQIVAKGVDRKKDFSKGASMIAERLTQIMTKPNARKVMDAIPVRTQETIPHLVGGDTYFHSWLVKNTGTIAWTSKTTVEFTWGSKALKPVQPVISVPYLQPGDTGTVVAGLHVPDEPGKYESYWHFMHKGRRFGYWLGCEVIVDPVGSQHHNLSSENLPVRNVDVFRPLLIHPLTRYDPVLHDPLRMAPPDLTEYKILGQGIFGDIKVPVDSLPKVQPDEKVVENKFGSLKLEDEALVTTTPGSAPDNESDSVDSDDSTSTKSSKDDFFVVEQSECAPNVTNQDDAECEKDKENVTTQTADQTTASVIPKVEATQNTSNDNDLHDMVYVNVPVECVAGDNQQIGKPKEQIRAESKGHNMILRGFLDGRPQDAVVNGNPLNATRSSESCPIQPQTDPYLSDSNMYQSHCSAAGSSFSDVNPYNVCQIPVDEQNTQHTEDGNSQQKPENQYGDYNSMNESRLFVFPHTRPGFEVLRPMSDTWPNATQTPPTTQQQPESASSASDTTTDSTRTINGASQAQAPPIVPQVHILPDNLVSGAVSVASSAINTARSVINMIAPSGPGKWVDGHWVSTQPKSVRETNLDRLAEMGFPNRDLNATLLARYDDDLMQVISQLL